jgi:hypothetical protein
MNQLKLQITVLCASTAAVLFLIGSGCTTLSEQPIRQASQSVIAEKVSKIKIAEAQGQVAQVLRKYLSAAGRQDAKATRAFLSSQCKEDLVTECQANAQSGWSYSEEYTKVQPEILGADGKSAEIEADVVFGGGGTFMSTEKTFYFVLENGTWKISGIDPAPRQTGPGIRPL